PEVRRWLCHEALLEQLLARIDVAADLDCRVGAWVASVGVHVVPLADDHLDRGVCRDDLAHLPQGPIALDIVGIQPGEPWPGCSRKALGYGVGLPVVAFTDP